MRVLFAFACAICFLQLPAIAQSLERCNCPRVEVQDLQCNTATCSGTTARNVCIGMRGFGTSCSNCEYALAPVICCDRAYDNATSTGPCGFRSVQLEDFIEWKSLDAVELTFLNCQAGYAPTVLSRSSK